jgi:uncharacterized membrane protein YcjF (UPF0283 family)
MQLKNIFAVALVCTGAAQWCVAGSQPDQNELLTTATVFKLGLVGFAPHISEEELALVTLLKRPKPHTELAALLRNAKSNEAKLYALCGMREISRAHYERALSKTKWDGESVNLMRADVISKASLEEQVQRIKLQGCNVHY